MRCLLRHIPATFYRSAPLSLGCSQAGSWHCASAPSDTCIVGSANRSRSGLLLVASVKACCSVPVPIGAAAASIAFFRICTARVAVDPCSGVLTLAITSALRLRPTVLCCASLIAKTRLRVDLRTCPGPQQRSRSDNGGYPQQRDHGFPFGLIATSVAQSNARRYLANPGKPEDENKRTRCGRLRSRLLLAPTNKTQWNCQRD